MVDLVLTRERFLAIAREFVDGYQIDEHNEGVIDALIDYFNEDLNFEKKHETFSLRKGLLLIGTVGSGKTMLMRIFQRYQLYKFKKTFVFSPMSDVAQKFMQYGNLDMYNEACLAIDDFGIVSQEQVSHYGTKANALERLVGNRYNHFQTLSKVSHFTTNLTKEQIKQEYDARIWSRLQEMCNIIPLSCEFDRRAFAKPKMPLVIQEKKQLSEEQENIDTVNAILLHYKECKDKKQYQQAGVFDMLAWLYYDTIVRLEIWQPTQQQKLEAWNQSDAIVALEHKDLYRKVITASEQRSKTSLKTTASKALLYQLFIMHFEKAEQVLETFLNKSKKIIN